MKPFDIVDVAGSRKGFCPIQIPRRDTIYNGYQPPLVGIHTELQSVANPFADFFDVADILTYQCPDWKFTKSSRQKYA